MIDDQDISMMALSREMQALSDYVRTVSFAVECACEKVREYGSPDDQKYMDDTLVVLRDAVADYNERVGTHVT